MFFLLLTFLVVQLGLAYPYESMVKFESSFSVIRKINFHTVDNRVIYCGVYETRCQHRKGYSVKKIYNLSEDKEYDLYLMQLHIDFYPDETCSSDNKIMEMDIHNQIKVVSKKYHRVEITTANIFVTFPVALPKEYRCNFKPKPNEPVSLKTLICYHGDSRDIFKSSRTGVRKSYPANAYFTNYSFDVADSTGIQVRLHQTSSDNCPLPPTTPPPTTRPPLPKAEVKVRPKPRPKPKVKQSEEEIPPDPVVSQPIDTESIIASIREVESEYYEEEERKRQQREGFRYENVNKHVQENKKKNFSFFSYLSLSPDSPENNNNSFIRIANIIVHFMLLGSLIYIFYFK